MSQIGLTVALELDHEVEPPGDGNQFRDLARLFAVVLLALGINKQLDLQTAFTEVMRVVAREQGWYETRRQYQYVFIGAAVVLATSAGAALITATWRLDRALKLAALGLVFVLAFVTVRAMSFHHVDALLGTRVLRVRVNWMFEIGAIAVVIVGSVLRLMRPTGARESLA
jgi:Mn2+/Fe2+ NRAMP family transporter